MPSNSRDSDENELEPVELGRKLIVALQSVTDPQVLMQAIADRSNKSLRSELTTRIDAMEKAIEVAHDDLVRVPTEVQKSVHGLRELVEAKIERLIAIDDASSRHREMLMVKIHEAQDNLRAIYEEKFNSIHDTIEVLKATVNDRFTQNDKSTEKAFNAAEKAVSERDASNKERPNKREANLTKLIGALDDNVKTLSGSTSDQIVSNKTTLDDKINDLKDRMSAFEGRLSTGAGEKRGADDNSARMIQLVGIMIGVGGVVIAAVTLLTHLK